MELRVRADRLHADFAALSRIGGTPDGGVERTTFSEAHLVARAWFHEQARAAGLETRVDTAANYSAVLRAADPAARTLMLGSHLDTVRRGGRYDGALGVVCALEVLRTIKDAGLDLPVTLEAIDFTGCVATVGDIVTEPGSYNVVPGRATLQLECRAADDVRLTALELALTQRALAEAEAFGLDVTVEPVGRWEPAPTDPTVRALIAGAASALGLTSMQVPSGAGHDAQWLAAITRSGMVFVPSVGGISHDASEHTAWADCVNGANVLLHATVRLAQAERASG